MAVTGAAVGLIEMEIWYHRRNRMALGSESYFKKSTNPGQQKGLYFHDP